MHKKVNTLLIMLVLFIMGCSGGIPLKKTAPKREGYIQENIKSEEKAEVNLPWKNNPKFNREIKKNNNPDLIACYHATLPDPILNERHNITLAADYLKGTVTQPGEVFSLNRSIGWRSAQRGFKSGPIYYGGRISSTIGGGVCKIASVIYNVAVLANQEIIERHPHSMTVPYVPPGQDATISYGTKDFKFRNITGAPILIWAQNTGGTLYIAFYGKYKPPKIKWIHETLNKSKTWTEYVWDSSLAKGTQKTVVEGSDGITVYSRIEITTPNGDITVKDMGISAYRPCPRIVAKGSR